MAKSEAKMEMNRVKKPTAIDKINTAESEPELTN